jgi:hypothetical protein
VKDFCATDRGIAVLTEEKLDLSIMEIFGVEKTVSLNVETGIK